MGLGLTQVRIVDPLPAGSYAGDSVGREELLPGSDATLPAQTVERNTWGLS